MEKLVISGSGSVGIGMREERKEVEFSDNWNRVKIEKNEYPRSVTSYTDNEVIVRYEKRVWRDHISAAILRQIMKAWRAIGWGTWADKVEAGGEDGDTYDRLGEIVSTGEFEEIARASISQCRFFQVETKIVCPSTRLHIVGPEAAWLEENPEGGGDETEV